MISHLINNEDTIRRSFELRSPFSKVIKPLAQRILIVTDGYSNGLSGSFGYYYFGLSNVVNTLLNTRLTFNIQFQLTLAHRQQDPLSLSEGDDDYARFAPNYENFRFINKATDAKTGEVFDITKFDQIWLFGVRELRDYDGVLDSDRLDDGELALLTNWMQAGGSLFATGDHETLGSSLCSRVPRIAKMRKWVEVRRPDGTMSTPPPQGGPDRHDTLMKGHDGKYTFDDESDDVPMTIYPKYYRIYNPISSQFIKKPHPVLCGRDGVIDILPDHPHEGEVVAESEVDISDTLPNGQPEFPQYEGAPLGPEVIATARVQSDHTNQNDTNKGEANGKEFGAIGTYDGQKVNVGRVVVDSTWHHWFDVNLIGRPVNTLTSCPISIQNPKHYGFLYSDEGIKNLCRIQNYHINVAYWLIPVTSRYDMLKGLMWHYVNEYPALERVRPNLSIPELGRAAQSILSGIVGLCLVPDVLSQVMPDDMKRIMEDIRQKGSEGIGLNINENLITTYLLGGMTRQLLLISDSLNKRKSVSGDRQGEIDGEVREALTKGMEEGFGQMLEVTSNANRQTADYLGRMEKMSMEDSLRKKHL